MKFGVGVLRDNCQIAANSVKIALVVSIHTSLKGVNQVLPTLYVLRPIDQFL